MAIRVSPTNALSDVQATVNAASAGDTVQIPAGNVTWAGQLTVNKGITLTCTTMWSPNAYPFVTNPTDQNGGAAVANSNGSPTFGQGLVITNNAPGNAMINVSLPATGPNFGLSQIAFVAGSNSAGSHLTVSGGSGTGATGSPVPLVTNCWFNNGSGSSSLNHCISWQMNGGVFWNNLLWGNNTSLGCFNLPFLTANPGPWATPSTMGTTDTSGLNNTYIETNTFIGWTQQALDLDSTCRTVIRFNTFNNACCTSHGQDSGPNGCRHWEIYNNTWRQNQTGTSATTGASFPLPFGTGGWLLRGGTGVIFNNSMQQFANQLWGNKAQWLFGSFNLQEVPNAIPCQTIYPAARQPGQSWSGGTGSYGFPTPGTTAVDGTGYITDPIWMWNNQYPNINNSGGTLVPFGTQDQTSGQQAPCSPSFSFGGNDANGVAWFSGQTASGSPVSGGRDYNDNSSITGTAGAKPGYTSFQYPHPLTSQSGPVVPTPATLVQVVSTPSYVQSNGFVILTTATSMSATFTSAQTASNCNLVFVWCSNANAVNSVIDTAGNTYSVLYRAVIDNLGAWQVVVYICNGILASSSNTVTANLNLPASNPSAWGEIIVAEYKGIVAGVTPSDLNFDSQGSGTSPSTSITTSNANDMIVSWLGYVAPVVGVTTPLGHNLEFTMSPQTGTSNIADFQVFQTGTYSSNWTLSQSNMAWQVVDISLKSTISSNPVQSIVLSWLDSDPTITTYHVKYGNTPGGPYGVVINVGAVNTFTLSGLNSGTYYLVVSAFNSVGESANSNQVTAVVQASSALRITLPLGNANVTAPTFTARTTLRPLLTRF